MAQRHTIESINYPYLHISWQVRGVEQQGWAYLDTGFDGHLAVPESMLAELGLPDYLTPYRLVGEQRIWAPSYEGSLTLLGFDPSFPASIVALGTELLLGRHLIDRFTVTFDHGQRLEVQE
ncbi:MAG: hypothetical protein HYY02_03830 [Chloroflexi bacterium]|nr:hypothetical protein [Chloroflexota bacterium]